MSTFIKLAVTALVLNACVQAGRSAWTFYQFDDAVQQAVLFSARETPTQLRNRILAVADEHQVPLDPETLDVEFVQTQARVKGSYTDGVKLVPGAYVYQWTHNLDLDIRRVPY
jgi:hypothetical protein